MIAKIVIGFVLVWMIILAIAIGESREVRASEEPLYTYYFPIVFASGEESSAIGPVYAPTPEPEPVPVDELVCFTDPEGVTNCEYASLLPPQWETEFWYGVERIAWCESHYRIYRISITNDYGFMQIHWPTHTPRLHRLGYTWDDMLTLGPNLWVAYDLYKEQWWYPWSCRYVLYG